MSYNCFNIIEIDLSEFDCTNVLSCEYMFAECHRLHKINLGKLNFSLVTTFRSMFYNCYNLDNLDVSNFNTKNSKSFRSMFSGCENLKMIDVSKFDSSKCENMNYMFYDCKNISEIDMINWNMSNLKYENEDQENPINSLFSNCTKLKKIKISGNLKKEVANHSFDGFIFYNISRTGDLITSKNVICNIPLDGYLPQNWSRNKE